MTRPALPARLEAADGLLATAGDRLPGDVRVRLDDLVARSRGRLAIAGERTVVALAGPTGVGKSSLVNALVRAELAVVGVTRPTTSDPLAVVVGDEPVEDLLAHLGVARWERLPASGREELDGLVLLDLPDHDSVVTAHRDRAAALVAVADRLVWVVDPEKYADASVHDDLLVPLREHTGVLTVVCNRMDRVRLGDRTRVAADLLRLLAERGLAGTDVLSTSVSEDTGVDQLRALLAGSVADHRAAGQRIDADLRTIAAAVGPSLPPDQRGGRDTGIAAVVDAALQAAGAPAVLDAVAAAHRHRARRATGWPPLRRLQARGRDPLARLGLDRARDAGEVGDRSARPVPHGIATASLRTAVRASAASSTAGWPPAWADPVADRLDAAVQRLPAELDRVVVGSDLDDERRPRWWGLAGLVQWLGVLTLVAGLGWLLTDAVIDWLQLPALPRPTVGVVPLPSLLVAVGLLVGPVLGALGSATARAGARRARTRVERRLRRRIGDVVDDEVLLVLSEETERANLARHHLDTLRGPGR